MSLSGFAEPFQNIFTRSTCTISLGVIETDHVELFAVFAHERSTIGPQRD
jgi:hypothetical protein